MLTTRRADRRARRADPAAVRDAQPSRGGSAAGHHPRRQADDQPPAEGASGCCRRCSTPAPATGGWCWSGSVTTTGCRCSNRRSRSRSGSPRRPAAGRSILATARTEQGCGGLPGRGGFAASRPRPERALVYSDQVMRVRRLGIGVVGLSVLMAWAASVVGPRPDVQVGRRARRSTSSRVCPTAAVDIEIDGTSVAKDVERATKVAGPFNVSARLALGADQSTTARRWSRSMVKVGADSQQRRRRAPAGSRRVRAVDDRLQERPVGGTGDKANLTVAHTAEVPPADVP